MCKVLQNRCSNTINRDKNSDFHDTLFELQTLLANSCLRILANLLKNVSWYAKSDEHQKEKANCAKSMNRVDTRTCVQRSHCQYEEKHSYCLCPESCLWYLHFPSCVYLRCLCQPPKSCIYHNLHQWCHINHYPTKWDVPWVEIGCFGYRSRGPRWDLTFSLCNNLH